MVRFGMLEVAICDDETLDSVISDAIIYNRLYTFR
jgi:hypothetical protein